MKLDVPKPPLVRQSTELITLGAIDHSRRRCEFFEGRIRDEVEDKNNRWGKKKNPVKPPVYPEGETPQEAFDDSYQRALELGWDDDQALGIAYNNKSQILSRAWDGILETLQSKKQSSISKARRL